MKKMKSPLRLLPQGIFGFLLYVAFLSLAAGLLPASSLDPTAKLFIAGIGLIAAWRYTWGMVNFCRSLVYRRHIFPKMREKALLNEDQLLPSKIYILMTVFRINTDVLIRTVRNTMEEAARCGIPVTIVASIVELQDEFLFKTIFQQIPLSQNIDLKIIRVPGTGKRSGLAHGFRVISRDLPPHDAVVVVMDGDTMLVPDTLRRCVPFFKLIPGLGALTTDEVSQVRGSDWLQDWHDMRFAQRHILMSSISLSNRLMTLTGRMSIYRADIITNPDFIDNMLNDYLDHWRLGRFKFLTGDDKSSLYWVMKEGYKQLYVPDVQVLAFEDPTHKNFFVATSQLMFRWFGNMLRTNERIVKLGPMRMPLFVWWAFVDQRLSIWTTMSGPIFAAMLSLKYGPIFFAYYFVWVGFVRMVMSLMLLSSRYRLNWRYPFLLYYSQIYGAFMKSWVLFRLDVQSWTRQKTKMERGLGLYERLWNKWSSHAVHASTVILFVCLIGWASSTLLPPHSALRLALGPSYYSYTP